MSKSSVLTVLFQYTADFDLYCTPLYFAVNRPFSVVVVRKMLLSCASC